MSISFVRFVDRYQCAVVYLMKEYNKLQSWSWKFFLTQESALFHFNLFPESLLFVLAFYFIYFHLALMPGIFLAMILAFVPLCFNICLSFLALRIGIRLHLCCLQIFVPWCFLTAMLWLHLFAFSLFSMAKLMYFCSRHQPLCVVSLDPVLH